jgi:hypothetical protein
VRSDFGTTRIEPKQLQFGLAAISDISTRNFRIAGNPPPNRKLGAFTSSISEAAIWEQTKDRLPVA